MTALEFSWYSNNLNESPRADYVSQFPKAQERDQTFLIFA